LCFSGFSCSSFSKNNPNLPIQIIAITEPVGTNSFFNDISQQLLTDGCTIANRLKSQFITITNSLMQKGDFYLMFKINKMIFRYDRQIFFP